ncbi:MAG: esterase family protein [Melioribacteraceae bacterium]|nr:esterase family protein [Melioribacteraceae bacterium]MCF8356424.1 esterase family protein [Melioribacteraceae bacterium]MCF8395779.1 esterase family protein [Melioribacteraceae bacterium]MCF8420908.1 esterase family protein [Melioribacteraceae bacterium]
MKAIRFIILLGFIAANLYGQYSRGKVIEGQTINSEIMGKEIRYTVYLPFDYEISERYYPVVYLLHGYTDNDMAWIQFGEANMLCDKAIAENEIPSMILVTPDADVSWYINNYDNSVRYEDFFINEFIPFIESEFRIRKEKRFRAVSGLSMGGYGSLVYALKHPGMFSACAPFSAAVYSKKQIVETPPERWDYVFGVVFCPGLEGESRMTDHLMSNNIFEIIKNAELEKLKSVRMYIDCGDDDWLLTGNMELNQLLNDLEIPHEFRVRDGKHSWTYWRTGLIDALKFIGGGFHQQ